MFAKYCVLFVGYSHNDTVMEYLARGLPPDRTEPRFALDALPADANAERAWRYRGIQPLFYAKDESGGHTRLTEAVAAWEQRANRGALDTELRIKQLVTIPPPLDKESQDELEASIAVLPSVRFFTRYATSPEWLEWLSQRKALEPLFSMERLPPIATELANWIALQYATRYPDAVFAAIEGRGGSLNHVFVYFVVRQLAYADPIPDKDTLQRWVPILIEAGPRMGLELTELMRRCLSAGADAAALLIFGYISAPRLKLRKSFALPSDPNKAAKFDARIEFVADHHWLSEAWTKMLRPGLGEFANRLWPIVIRNLQSCYDLYAAWGKADREWDPLSWGRSAIEPHEQDRYPEVLDVLIDSARDILEHTLLKSVALGRAMIGQLVTCEPLIFRRIAAHGVTLDPERSADDKLLWLLDNDLVMARGLKHEVFQVLRVAYPLASLDLRTRLLNEVYRHIESMQPSNEEEKRSQAYQKFNLLHWLQKADPNCQLVTQRLDAVKQQYPMFLPREHPDLDHWTRGVESVGHASPRSPEELLATAPEEQLEFLLSFQGDRFDGPDRDGLLASVATAAAGNFEWSVKLANALGAHERWTSDLWGSILRGWSNATLSSEQWTVALATINRPQIAAEFGYLIASLIEAGIEKDPGVLPLERYSTADEVALQVWQSLQQQPAVTTREWLSTAINHSGGRLALFWLKVLSHLHKQTPSDILSNLFRERLQMLLTGHSEAAILARPVVVSQISFLYGIDAEWTRREVISLLDWHRDPGSAAQAWDGWLSWGRLDESLATELLPHYRAGFTRLDQELSDERDRFIEHIAATTVYWLNNPLNDGWTRDFLVSVSEEDRARFARHVARFLGHLESDVKIRLWDRWLRTYWTRRIQGAPVPLTQGELSEMIEWIVPLEPVFPEVVEMICAVDVPKIGHTTLFHRLRQSPIPTKYPADSARLLIHLASSPELPGHHCDDLEELARGLLRDRAPAPLLNDLCNELARLGCGGAAQIREQTPR
jgi:hypothetical protein